MLLVRQEDITRCVPRLVIQDTPALERLLVVDQEGPTRINVISVVKLIVVGYSSDKYSKLVIGSTPVQVHDTSILHHAFISIFIALWDVITHYVTILMPILSYFKRFT